MVALVYNWSKTIGRRAPVAQKAPGFVQQVLFSLREASYRFWMELSISGAGLIYKTEDAKQWLKRRFAMFHEILEDSWSYQEMVQKGLDVGLQKGLDQGLQQGLQKGLDQGIKQGELMAAHSFLARIIEKHFPPLLPLALRKTERLKTVDALNSVIDKLLEAKTVEQAREVLEEDAQ